MFEVLCVKISIVISVDNKVCYFIEHKMFDMVQRGFVVQSVKIRIDSILKIS